MLCYTVSSNSGMTADAWDGGYDGMDREEGGEEGCLKENGLNVFGTQVQF